MKCVVPVDMPQIGFLYLTLALLPSLQIRNCTSKKIDVVFYSLLQRYYMGGYREYIPVWPLRSYSWSCLEMVPNDT